MFLLALTRLSLLAAAYRWLYRKEGGSGERLEDLEQRHLVRRQASQSGAERLVG